MNGAAVLTGAAVGVAAGWVAQDRRPCGVRWWRNAYTHAWSQVLSIPRDGGRVELLDIVGQSVEKLLEEAVTV